VELVIESTGLFTDADKNNPKSCYGHITAGAKEGHYFSAGQE
jgi:hypothetical protein